MQALRLLSDATRLRLLSILTSDDLSVAEIQEILGLGQSRVSTHLASLRKGGLLEDRREGKKVFYRLATLPPQIAQLVEQTISRSGLDAQLKADRKQLDASLRRRREETEAHFNQLTGRAGKSYCAGRSWQSVASLFLEMVEPLVIADLGAGEGLVSRLLARRAKHVIAVDISSRMVTLGRDAAERLGLDNLEFRLGDLEAPPVEDKSVDIALFSQALHHAPSPQKALAAAHRILKPGGRLLVLDLKQHQFDAARELYSDLWLGFRESDLQSWIHASGFEEISVRAIERESAPPHFQSLLATAKRKK